MTAREAILSAQREVSKLPPRRRAQLDARFNSAREQAVFHAGYTRPLG